MTPSRLLWLIPTAMLVIALAPLPYGYYTLLRIVVCVCACIIVWQSVQVTGRAFSAWSVVFIMMAILFNPIIRVHLKRDVWAIVDLACAALFIVHMLLERDRKWLGAERR